MKKKYKKYKKSALGLGVGTVGLSLGSQVIGGLGTTGTAATVASKGQTGMYNVARFAPVVGTAIGGGATLSMLGELKPPKRRKRR